MRKAERRKGSMRVKEEIIKGIGIRPTRRSVGIVEHFRFECSGSKGNTA